MVRFGCRRDDRSAMNQANATATKTAAASPGESWWGRLTRAPVILQAFMVFALVASFFSLLAVSVPPLGRVVMPYIGGGNPVIYLNALLFAVLATVVPPGKAIVPARKMVYVAIGFLGFATLFEAFEIFRYLAWPEPIRVNSQNPYLVYHDLRPAFSIVLPVCWMLLLLAPSVRKWIHPAGADADYRPYQVSLADFLYLMLVVCLGLAASLTLAGFMQRARQSITPPASGPKIVPATPGTRKPSP